MQTHEPPKTERAKILITVKTYPLLSSKHTETVCTAGLREEGKWIRIYPVPFRMMDKEKRFKKYQWIEAEIIKDTRDPRPESYRLAGEIKPLHCLDTQKAWEERKKLVLSKVFHNLDTLIHEARDTNQSTSLATFKPKRIVSSLLNAIHRCATVGRNSIPSKNNYPKKKLNDLFKLFPSSFTIRL